MVRGDAVNWLYDFFEMNNFLGDMLVNLPGPYVWAREPIIGQ